MRLDVPADTGILEALESLGFEYSWGFLRVLGKVFPASADLVNIIAEDESARCPAGYKRMIENIFDNSVNMEEVALT